jgi:hypothetical protein
MSAKFGRAMEVILRLPCLLFLYADAFIEGGMSALCAFHKYRLQWRERLFKRDVWEEK